MKTIKLSFLLFAIYLPLPGVAQNCNHHYTHQDTLRGSITTERAWWDLMHYELYVEVDPQKKEIKGSNVIKYVVLDEHNVMQIDLQEPLSLDKATQNGKELKVTHDGNAHFIELSDKQNKGDTLAIKIAYSGVPHEAKMAPWDGGFTWSKDENNNPFIATSCQGIGASIWWPCKDHMYDEPDRGMIIHANVPSKLKAVSNGRLIQEQRQENMTTTYTWQVVNPINNYGVNLNIGDYINFGEQYKGLNGDLDMNYWVLKDNLDKAKVQFKDAVRMMEAFEYWLGPYPFYEDGYKLVEVPYLGMEHQSSVTYGNGYQNGYMGRDRSQTGWGNKFDFIIIHESGHEWFANNITYKDMADMWIHESFTTYSESLFVEYHYGKEAGAEYNRGKRSLIANQEPLITDYNVNASPPGDIYPKGTNVIHTLRQVVNDDELWRAMLVGLNKEFYHQTVTTKLVELYIAQMLDLDLRNFFDQYLRDKRVPTFEYRIMGDELKYRWTNCIPGFDMPLRITIDGKETVLEFKNKGFNKLKLDKDNPVIKVDANYYVYTSSIMGQ